VPVAGVADLEARDFAAACFAGARLAVTPGAEAFLAVPALAVVADAELLAGALLAGDFSA
jgi:hypothetical protein